MNTCDRSDVYPSTEVDAIVVFSWNLLAPTLDRYGLDWKTVRLPALRDWLKRFVACDVLCFQEVDLNHSLADIVEILSKYGFAAVVQERKGFPIVNATFYKSSRLQVMSVQHRSRALLINFLAMSGREVCIGNVHLDAFHDSQRRSQLASALKRMHGSNMSIICGDFNSSMEAGSQIESQLAEAGFIRAPTKGITWTPGGRGEALDHIWASESLAPVRILSSPKPTLESIRDVGLPNTTHPSDHLPVAASFRFRLQLRQASDSFLNPAFPTSIEMSIREEWLEILRIGSLCKEKADFREQKKTRSLIFGNDLSRGCSEASRLAESCVGSCKGSGSWCGAAGLDCYRQ